MARSKRGRRWHGPWKIKMEHATFRTNICRSQAGLCFRAVNPGTPQATLQSERLARSSGDPRRRRRANALARSIRERLTAEQKLERSTRETQAGAINLGTARRLPRAGAFTGIGAEGAIYQ